MSRYEQFDRSRLLIKPLAERQHDLHLDRWLSLSDPTPPFEHPDLAAVAARLAAATSAGAARILMMGAHVLRAGVNRHIIDLVERGFVDHIAMNGVGAATMIIPPVVSTVSLVRTRRAKVYHRPPTGRWQTSFYGFGAKTESGTLTS